MKKLFAALSIFAVLFSISLNTSAAEVTLKGFGGAIYDVNTGNVHICPNQSKDDCATVIISGNEITQIIIHSTKDASLEENLLKDYTIIVANPQVLTNDEVQGSDIVLILKKK